MQYRVVRQAVSSIYRIADHRVLLSIFRTDIARKPMAGRNAYSEIDFGQRD